MDDDAEFMEKRRKWFDHFKKCMREALAEPVCDDRPRPWRAEFSTYDGAGVMFVDANGRPVLSDPIRDVDDAAYLLGIINAKQ